MCVRRLFASPSYEGLTNNEMAVQCPDGYRLLQHRKHHDDDYLNKMDSPDQKTKYKGHKRNLQCVSFNIVSPSSQDTCMAHFHWSPQMDGCLMLEAQSPTEQCPRPDIKLGVGRGDWQTPHFVYDAELNRCATSSTPALYPQCPPGWALEGLFKPYCYKKIYSRLIYDCDNLQGFEIRRVSCFPIVF